MWIGFAVALVGSIAAGSLVRQKDFVPSWAPAEATAAA
jgi:hypothetical protein